MRVLVIGGGGREHAIVKKLKESGDITKLYCAPGNAGISYDAQCVPISATDVAKMADWAEQNKIDYAVVAPDDPLVLGMVDEMQKRGIPSFGPNADAAIIEGSKIFSKNLMRKYAIPTADYSTFDNAENALQFVSQAGTFPLVIKADGLALGKGVLICETKDEAVEAVKEMMQNSKFGSAGTKIVVEEFLQGPEVSVLSFTDGECVVPMVSSMDHKRAHDGDTGLNTGGMGTIAPNPYYTKEIAQICMDTIFVPTVQAMKKEGRPFKGCLYFGLMLTQAGPKVIEYNCRFGDPETQVVLPLLKSDLLSIMRATTDGTLASTKVEFSNGSAACVVLASGGYPEAYEKGKVITGLKGGQVCDDIVQDTSVYHAGTSFIGEGADQKLATNGGRVLGVTSTADTLQNAVAKAYTAAQKINFDGVFMRSDIGKKALLK